MGNGANNARQSSKSPSKGRSLSDVTEPVLSPSPKFREPEKRAKDDNTLDSPITPRRPAFTVRGLSLQLPSVDGMPTESAYSRVPLAPQVDHASTYGSPASVPRRSRGLDFSRAATHLHHFTLAEQSSPDSSPTIGGRGMNIPNRRSGLFGTAESTSATSASLWTSMGGPDRTTTMSSSLGSVNMLGSDSSSSDSGEDDTMDADEVDESILTTPQVHRGMGPFGLGVQASPGSNWMGMPSPARNSLRNFQRARIRTGKKVRKTNRSGSGGGAALTSPCSKSPPNPRSRRESISWAANQLHISGSESDDGVLKANLDNTDGVPITPGRDGQRGVIKRAVTRRGNMLPKTKGFARIRAALAEESAPVETEVRREADVVRQVREADTELEHPRQPSLTQSMTALSSPSLEPVTDLGDIPEDDMMGDSSSTPSTDRGLSSSFKLHALHNSKGKKFWDTFNDQHTPPPPSLLPRCSSSAMSEDMPMESPSFSTASSSLHGAGFIFPTADDTQTPPSPNQAPAGQTGSVPTAADIARRVNKKRGRDEDFDLASFKRRAVSPSLSVQNSPILQSPMQRDINPWGTRSSSNSGSSGGEKSSGGAAGTTEGATRPIAGAKRIGFQGMVDTSDGLMKMTIE
jgi:hypothetical protein